MIVCVDVCVWTDCVVCLSNMNELKNDLQPLDGLALIIEEDLTRTALPYNPNTHRK